MHIRLHKNAKLTPAVRELIAKSQEPARVLAARYHVTLATIYKWKRRQDFLDRPHTAHRLRTTLNAAQEAILVYLRRQYLIPLDDLLRLAREFLCEKLSRAALHRCLRRHGVGNLEALKPAAERKAPGKFPAYEPGYVHIDVKYLPKLEDQEERGYAFVAIDRATRWVFLRVYPDKSAESAAAFLRELSSACPFVIKIILTDNGKEFTGRVLADTEEDKTKDKPSKHEFKELCEALGIEHRRTRPRTPQTNGMVERFNARLSDILRTHRFDSSKTMTETLLRFVEVYNHHLPQKVLDARTPWEKVLEWYQKQPDIFKHKPYNRPRPDT